MVNTIVLVPEHGAPRASVGESAPRAGGSRTRVGIETACPRQLL